MPDPIPVPSDDPLDLVEQLLQAQEELTARVAGLEEQLAGQGSDEEPEDLDEWVAWLIPTYALEAVLRDWRSQPGIVRELSALMKAHIEVIGKRKGFDDVVWHGHLASMVTRIQALRGRLTTDRQNAATHGGALAGILRKGTPANDVTNQAGS